MTMDVCASPVGAGDDGGDGGADCTGGAGGAGIAGGACRRNFRGKS